MKDAWCCSNRTRFSTSSNHTEDAFARYSMKVTMMKTVRFAFFVVFVLAALSANSVHAGWPGGCPPWRPCGPGNTMGGNRLVAQGFFGADFRPSCSSHDACLAAGVPRAQCDRQFLNNMNSACDSSNHPFLCRMKAFQYYAGARLFGGLYY